MTTVAIMQPTYLPWPGFFNLMARSDVFVFLDDVQFSKQSWQSRNRIMQHGREQLLVVPVLASRNGRQRINEVLVSPDPRWRRKHAETIRQSYSKHPNGKETAGLVSACLGSAGQRLVDVTIGIIECIRGALGIPCRTVRASQLPVPADGRSERLLAICRHCNADEFLSAGGSRAYLEADGVFAAAGLPVRYQSFPSLPYPQHGSTKFMPYLSIIDLLANVGMTAAADYVRTTSERASVCLSNC